MELFKQFSIYTLTTFLVAGIPFLLLPVLTRYLSPEDYGTLSLMNSIIRVAIPFVTLGGVYAITLEYFKVEKPAFSEYFSSVWFLQLGAFVFVLLLFFLFGKALGDFFNLPYNWLIVIPFLCLFSISEEIALALLRNENKPKTYGILRVTKVIIEISLTLFLVIGLSMNWKGRLLSWIIVVFLFFIGAAFWFYRQDLLHFKKIKKKSITAALSFGLPLIPDQLSTFFLNASDRFFIARLENLDEVGLYSVGSQIGTIILILVFGFILTFGPYQFNIMKEGTYEGKIKIVQISIIFLIVLAFAILAVYLFSPIIFYLIDVRYVESAQYVIWIAGGYFFWGIYCLAQQYFLFEKKTKVLMYLTIGAILLNLILNYFLVVKFGTIGAAYSTTISYIFLGIVAIFISNKFYPMPWKTGIIRLCEIPFK